MNDLVQEGLRAEFALTNTPSAADAPPVYKSTTIPYDKGSDPNGTIQHSNNSGNNQNENGIVELKSFSNLPVRDPVDIQFKDITYCVNVGFRQG